MIVLALLLATQEIPSVVYDRVDELTEQAEMASPEEAVEIEEQIDRIEEADTIDELEDELGEYVEEEPEV